MVSRERIEPLLEDASLRIAELDGQLAEARSILRVLAKGVPLADGAVSFSILACPWCEAHLSGHKGIRETHEEDCVLDAFLSK